MIGRSHRFHGYNSLRQTYQHGQSVRGQLATLRYRQRDPAKPYRVAVVVSRKTSKSAVTRNRIRRRIYELVRQHEAQVALGSDLIFTVFTDRVASVAGSELEQAITDLLRKAAPNVKA